MPLRQTSGIIHVLNLCKTQSPWIRYTHTPSERNPNSEGGYLLVMARGMVISGAALATNIVPGFPSHSLSCSIAETQKERISHKYGATVTSYRCHGESIIVREAGSPRRLTIREDTLSYQRHGISGKSPQVFLPSFSKAARQNLVH